MEQTFFIFLAALMAALGLWNIFFNYGSYGETVVFCFIASSFFAISLVVGE